MIHFTKLRERVFSNNDIYILKNLGDQILINDDYRGITILDTNLEIVNSINLLEECPINTVLTNALNDQLLIDCSEENSIIFYDFAKSKMNVLTIFKASGAISELYKWRNNNVLLDCYNGLFYLLDIDNMKLTHVNKDFIQNNYAYFYGFDKAVQEYNYVYQIDTFNYSFIAQDPTKKTVTFIDYFNNKKVISRYYPEKGLMNILFKNNFFVFIREPLIIIENGLYSRRLHPERGYVFLRVILVEKENMLILVALSTNWKKDKLTTYKINL